MLQTRKKITNVKLLKIYLDQAALNATKNEILKQNLQENFKYFIQFLSTLRPEIQCENFISDPKSFWAQYFAQVPL